MLIIDRRDISARTTVLCCGFGEPAPLIASTVSVPAPQQSLPVSQEQTPLNSAATQEALIEGAPIPPPPVSSPERLRCSDPPDTHRSIPYARKRGVGATTVPFPQVPVSWRALRGPRRSSWNLGPARALRACVRVCLLRGVDGDKVDAFEEPNTSLFRSPPSPRPLQKKNHRSLLFQSWRSRLPIPN